MTSYYIKDGISWVVEGTACDIMTTALRFVECYEKGIITVGETLFQIIENASPTEITNLPEPWKSNVLKKINEAPTTEEEWNKLLFFTIGVWIGKQPTQEEQRKAYRERIEYLRKELADALQINRDIKI